MSNNENEMSGDLSNEVWRFHIVNRRIERNISPSFYTCLSQSINLSCLNTHLNINLGTFCICRWAHCPDEITKSRRLYTHTHREHEVHIEFNKQQTHVLDKMMYVREEIER